MLLDTVECDETSEAQPGELAKLRPLNTRVLVRMPVDLDVGSVPRSTTRPVARNKLRDGRTRFRVAELRGGN